MTAPDLLRREAGVGAHLGLAWGTWLTAHFLAVGDKEDLAVTELLASSMPTGP